ncbi:MAG: TetR/AcrR family transcriptional regulator [Pseudomonadota bacterium]
MAERAPKLAEIQPSKAKNELAAEFSFAAHLDASAAQLTGRKGEKTKARLIASTGRLLEDSGLHGLTHNHVCDAAGINVSTFYQYFPNKTEIVSHVIDLFLQFIIRLRVDRWAAGQQQAKETDDPYGVIYLSNLQVLNVASANPGLYRCVLQIGAERTVVAKRWQRLSAEYALRSARRVQRAVPNQSIEDLNLKATLLGGMVDDFCRNYFVFEDDAFRQPWIDKFATMTDLAVFLTDIWYQTMMNLEPPKDKERWLAVFD